MNRDRTDFIEKRRGGWISVKTLFDISQYRDYKFPNKIFVTAIFFEGILLSMRWQSWYISASLPNLLTSSTKAKTFNYFELDSVDPTTGFSVNQARLFLRGACKVLKHDRCHVLSRIYKYIYIVTRCMSHKTYEVLT